MTKPSAEEIENKFKEIFYFDENSNSENQFNGKMKEWIPIPETPLMCHNIATYGNFNIDNCSMFTKESIRRLDQISYFKIMYFKLFTMGIIYNNYSKHLIFCSDLNKAMREMSCYFSAPEYRVFSDLLGNLFQVCEFVENDIDVLISKISELPKKEQAREIVYKTSKFYLRSYINSLVDIFRGALYLDISDYPASHLNVCLSYLLTFIIFNFMKMIIIFLQISFKNKNGLTDGISKMIQGIEFIDNTNPEFYTCCTKFDRQMKEIFFSVIINKSKKYLNKLMQTDNLTDDEDAKYSIHQLFNMDDVLFVIYNILHTDGTLLNDDGIEICKKFTDESKKMKFDYLQFTNFENYKSKLTEYNLSEKAVESSIIVKLVLFLSTFMNETEDKNKELIDNFLNFKFKDVDEIKSEEDIATDLLRFRNEFDEEKFNKLTEIRINMQNEIIQALYCAMGEFFCSTTRERKRKFIN